MQVEPHDLPASSRNAPGSEAVFETAQLTEKWHHPKGGELPAVERLDNWGPNAGGFRSNAAASSRRLRVVASFLFFNRTHRIHGASRRGVVVSNRRDGNAAECTSIRSAPKCD